MDAFRPDGSGRVHRDGVLVRWRKASEASLLGFDVYRQAGARRVLLTTSLISGSGSVTDAGYHFLDRRAGRAPGARYWVLEIDRDGSHIWHGPATASR